MRRSLLLLVCAAVPAAAGPAATKAAKADKAPALIDATSVLDKLLAFRDEFGSLYVVPAPDSFSELGEAGKWVFYGDNKTLYQQRIFSSGAEGGKHYSWGMWAPRAKVSTAMIGPVQGKLAVTCSTKGERALTQLKPDEARTVLSSAKFYAPLWQRQAKFLARDENGTYYYVDELREEHGGNGHRVYMGQKGGMKELPMTNVVSDSEGDIYATKSGQLKIVAERGYFAYWIKGRKRLPLTVLEVTDNRYLIYRDLGIYGRLGAICDDL